MDGSEVPPLSTVTFHVVRLPKALLVLLFCLGVAAWVGYRAQFVADYVPAAAPPEAGTPEQGPAANLAEPGKPAPDFALPSLDGGTVSLSAYRGRPVILYFWASWCSYCLEGMPDLEALRDQYREQGLEVLAINIMESADKAKRTVSALRVSLPVLLDTSGEVTEQYLVKATPTYVFIDRDGVYRDALIGKAREGALEGRLQPLL